MFNRYRDMRRAKMEGLDQEGFTLIELLIVIIIMGILAAVVVFALGGVTGSSAIAACNTDAKSVEVGVQAYVTTNNGSYPATISALVYSSTNTNAALHTWPANYGYYFVGIATVAGTVDYVTYANSGTTTMTAATGSQITAATAPIGSVWIATSNGGASPVASNWQNFDTYVTTAGGNICSLA